jgi:hypothetical protein
LLIKTALTNKGCIIPNDSGEDRAEVSSNKLQKLTEDGDMKKSEKAQAKDEDKI